MAKQVKVAKGREFTFKIGSATTSRYEWDAWFCGDLLLLEQSGGEKDEKGNIIEISPDQKRDYEVATESMPAKLKFAARRRYKVVQISRIDADGVKLEDAIIIRARDMDEDERTTEDIRRADAKTTNEDHQTNLKTDDAAATPTDDETD